MLSTVSLMVALLAFSPPLQVSPVKRNVTGTSSNPTDFKIETVPPDGMYEVTITPSEPATGNILGFWTITPRKSATIVKRNKSLLVVKVKPGSTYEVVYTKISGESQEDYWTEFTVGPAPVPPDPVVPPVNDPDLQKVQAAYDSDTPLDPMQRRVAAIKLAGYYSVAAKVCYASKSETVGPFFKEIAENNTLSPDLPAVRDIVARKLREVIPPPSLATAPITPQQRNLLGRTFEKYGKLVEAVSK